MAADVYRYCMYKGINALTDTPSSVVFVVSIHLNKISKSTNENWSVFVQSSNNGAHIRNAAYGFKTINGTWING